MITVSELRALEGKSWSKKPHDKLSPLEKLAWHAASDLSAFLEMTAEPEDYVKVQPDTWTVLWGLEGYFLDIGQLPPHGLAHVMLMHKRVMSGLTARGDDKSRPNKPD